MLLSILEFICIAGGGITPVLEDSIMNHLIVIYFILFLNFYVCVVCKYFKKLNRISRLILIGGYAILLYDLFYHVDSQNLIRTIIVPFQPNRFIEAILCSFGVTSYSYQCCLIIYTTFAEYTSVRFARGRDYIQLGSELLLWTIPIPIWHFYFIANGSDEGLFYFMIFYIVYKYCTLMPTIYQCWHAIRPSIAFGAKVSPPRTPTPTPPEDPEGQAEHQESPCSICLEHDTTQHLKLTCGHVFHQSCIETWFYSDPNHRTCPICRVDIHQHALCNLRKFYRIPNIL